MLCDLTDLPECKPVRVIRIVSGSRSGSSLLRSLLARSSDITVLSGEEEPYFAMSGNGFGITSSSDAFETSRIISFSFSKTLLFNAVVLAANIKF